MMPRNKTTPPRMSSSTPLLVEVVVVAIACRLEALAAELANTTEAITVPTEAMTERPERIRRLKVFMLAPIDTPPRTNSLPDGERYLVSRVGDLMREP